MNTLSRCAACLVLAALLAFVPMGAVAGPRVPSATAASNFVRGASIPSDAMPDSPFDGDLSGEDAPHQVFRIDLTAGDQFAVRLTSTELGVHAGLYPPSASDFTDDFVAWDDGNGGDYGATASYLHYVAPTSGTYKLILYLGNEASGEPTRFYVTWKRSPGNAKSNIPGAALPPGGTTGVLGNLANWNEVHRVAAGAGEGLHLRLTPEEDAGDIDLWVYKPGWDDIYRIPGSGVDPIAAASHASEGFAEELFFRAAASGDYYPVASLWGGPEPAEYELTYRITDPTTITALTTSALVNYGGRVDIYGALAEDGSPLTGEYLGLQAYRSGAWRWIAGSESTSDTTYPTGLPSWWTGPSAPTAPGAYAFRLYPTSNMRLRTNYTGVYWKHTPVISSTRDIMVKPYLPTLSAPSTVTHDNAFTVSGIIRPKHASGKACPIVIKVERRKSDGSYYVYKTVKTRGYTYSSYTKYVAKFSLPYKGTWRLRSYHRGDTATAANGSADAYSAYRTVKAK